MSHETPIAAELAGKINAAHEKHQKAKAKASAVVRKKKAKWRAVKRTKQADAPTVPAAPVKRRVPNTYTAGHPATQKARGIKQLSRVFGSMASQRRMPEHGTAYFQHTFGYADSIALLPYNMPDAGVFHGPRKLFARPCPEVPRHGFVESRPVKSIEELLCLWQEATIIDPLAELLVMERLTGVYSAVATDAGVTYGTGHDGVTGVGAQLWRVPGPQGGLRSYANSRLMNGESNFDGAYIEAVEDFGNVYAVQLRNGPEQPGGMIDYVPRWARIIDVIDARPYYDDLVGWETVIATHKNRGNETLITAIYAPGVSLASHVAVHGIAKGYAVLCDAERWGTEERKANPASLIGQYVSPSSTTPPPLTGSDYRTVARHMQALDAWHVGGKPRRRQGPTNRENPALTFPPGSGFYALSLDTISDTAQACIATSVATLHSQALWGNEAHLLRLRAFGPLVLFKFLAAACIGEDRHFWEHGPGAQGERSAVNWALVDPYAPTRPSGSRVQIYARALGLDVAALLDILPCVYEDFSLGWGNETRAQYDRDGEHVEDSGGSTGYGGKNWAKATDLALDLGKAIRQFIAAPSSSYWTALVVAYNKAVHAVHNNGTLLNKWGYSTEVLDMLAIAPQLGFLNTVAMRVIVGDHPVGNARALLSMGGWSTLHGNGPGLPIPEHLGAVDYDLWRWLPGRPTTEALGKLNELFEQHDLWVPR